MWPEAVLRTWSPMPSPPSEGVCGGHRRGLQPSPGHRHRHATDSELRAGHEAGVGAFRVRALGPLVTRQPTSLRRQRGWIGGGHSGRPDIVVGEKRTPLSHRAARGPHRQWAAVLPGARGPALSSPTHTAEPVSAEGRAERGQTPGSPREGPRVTCDPSADAPRAQAGSRALGAA